MSMRDVCSTLLHCLVGRYVVVNVAVKIYTNAFLLFCFCGVRDYGANIDARVRVRARVCV